MRVSRPMLVLFAAVVPCLLMLAACSSHPSAASTEPTSTVTPTPTATLTVPTREVTFPSDTGAMLEGTVFGSGHTAVILANQTDSFRNQWTPLAQTLAAHDYMVVTFEYEGQHGSGGVRNRGAYDKNVVSAVQFARSQGASRIALVGASIGGLAVAVAAPQSRAQAVVVVSAPHSWPLMADNDDYVHALTMPKLFLESELDEERIDIQYMYDHCPQPKEIHIYGGKTHGVAFFSAPEHEDFVQRIMAFVAANAPA